MSVTAHIAPTGSDVSPQLGDCAPRKAYLAPQLTVLGDVRDLTLGGTAGTGDSGNAGTQQF
jgi:hypothetical protein